jgi:hypothetical protein
MIRIAISVEAFEPIAVTLPGSVGFDREPDDNGERLIWLETAVVSRLRALRGTGELQRRDPDAGEKLGGEGLQALQEDSQRPFASGAPLPRRDARTRAACPVLACRSGSHDGHEIGAGPTTLTR